MGDKYKQEQYFGVRQDLTQEQIEEAAKLVAEIATQNRQQGYLTESDRVGAGLVGQQAKDTGIRNQ